MAANLTDLMPTLLDLTGHPIPEGIQGTSLAPWLTSTGDPADAPAFTFSERVGPNPRHDRKLGAGTRGSFMVRGSGWKYVRYAGGGEQLYDLGADPDETVDLAGEQAHAERKAEMACELDAWLAATDYPRQPT